MKSFLVLGVFRATHRSVGAQSAQERARSRWSERGVSVPVGLVTFRWTSCFMLSKLQACPVKVAIDVDAPTNKKRKELRAHDGGASKTKAGRAREKHSTKT